MSSTIGRSARAALAVAALATIAGCGGGGGGATVSVDGSSTVGPFTTKAAEDYRKVDDEVNVTVGISGTGGGFERFCRGETDLSDASRPIKDEEDRICSENRIEYLELTVATDALTNVVNAENDWATCVTVAELKKIWEPGSTVKTWKDVRTGFPDVALKLYGPGTDSGTFDYYTDVIVGEEGASRSDYSATEDDNVTVQGVTGDKGALGYFGFSYFEENQGSLKALAVDNGKGCVEPSVSAAQDGTYAPLSRPLFIYTKKSALERPEVANFLKFVIDNAASIAAAARFVPLDDQTLGQERAELDEAVSEAQA